MSAGPSRKSLRLLGTVGEPINPEAWLWYYDHVGDQRCPIVDTWWQTETGGILITPIPGATPLKPGSATRPFFGVEPVIVDGEGNRVVGACEGNLCLARSWPGLMRTVFGDHTRFIETYFSTFPGLYFTGDGVRRDADGFYWITGRVDDVINVAGHRLGTAEIESALVAHPKVAEAAVVGYPHDIKGQGIYAYVTLRVRRGSERRAARSSWCLGAEGDQPDRRPRPVAMGARSAEDPLRQDHAAHPAQDRGGRAEPARRRLDPGRPHRRRGARRQPNEPRSLATSRLFPSRAPAKRRPRRFGYRLPALGRRSRWLSRLRHIA